MCFRVWLILLALLPTPRLLAQVDLSDHFVDLLDAAGIGFIEPLEARYKDIRLSSRQLADYDFAMRSRREKLEIRYRIHPYRAEDPLSEAPHVRAIRLLMHLATNQQQAVMRGLEVDEEDLQAAFRADWGKVFFFQPKTSFSTAAHCKMLALHREGQGTAFVFFLFDEAGAALDHRFFALQFAEL